MAVLFAGLEEGLLRIRLDRNGGGSAEWAIRQGPVMCVVVDPIEPRYVYAGVPGHGVLRSEDGGVTFEPAGPGISRPRIWSLTVSPTERTPHGGAVYAGSMPSAVFKSEDGGRSFSELESFQDVPGKEDWSFPPQPTTHLIHVMTAPFHEEATVLAGIELGGVVRTSDGGETWHQVQGAGDDVHTLLTHRDAPGRYYEADGAGFVDSKDYGNTWKVDYAGIPEKVRYFYSMAVDPGDPDNIIISASRDQYSGHALLPNTLAFDRDVIIDWETIWSSQYRKTGDADWREVTEGLPDPNGNPLGRLTTNPAEPGAFYYLTIPGEIYRSGDGGDSWSRLEIAFPGDMAEKRIVHSATATEEA